MPATGISFRSEAARSRGAGNDVVEDNGADVPDLDMLSRSLPTGGPILEPEPSEYAILRPVISNQSLRHARNHGYIRGDESAVEEDEENEDDDEENGRNGDVDANRAGHLPTERSPLLRRASSTARSSVSALTDLDGPAPLFLNGVSRGRFWFIFSQVLLAQFIGCFDGTIMASSHPVITSYFGAANSASWLSTAFLLTSTAFQPLLGRLSDALGRKVLFIVSMLVFLFATLWCALADSIESFIMARALCGLGAGGSMTLGSIITSDLVPIEGRGAYQSYFNICYGIGSALGAALGGAMAEALGWRWEFGIQVPPLLICLGISCVAIPDDLGIAEERKSVMQAIREFDARGSLLLTTAISFLILGLSLGGNVLSWTHPFVISSLVIFAVGFPTFLWVESRVSKPIMPLHLILRSPRANLIFSNFIAAMLSNAIMFNIPIFFQAVLLTSATTSGLRLVVPTLIASVAGATTGFAVTWTRRLKWPLVLGTNLYLIGTICLTSLRRDLPDVVYLLALIPSSVGGGFQFPGTFMAILASSPQSEQAVVTSTLILWRSLGMVLGVAISSLVLQNALVHYLVEYVHGDLREEVIAKVRASVEAIATLDQPYREQVVDSYQAALRSTFGFCIIMAIVSIMIIAPVKLKRLPARRSRSSRA